jgi:hypothetical protein
LAGRLAGMNDQQIQSAWNSGDRDEVLKQAVKPKKS